VTRANGERPEKKNIESHQSTDSLERERRCGCFGFSENRFARPKNSFPLLEWLANADRTALYLVHLGRMNGKNFFSLTFSLQINNLSSSRSFRKLNFFFCVNEANSNPSRLTRLTIFPLLRLENCVNCFLCSRRATFMGLIEEQHFD
jgi:hypothetical protein